MHRYVAVNEMNESANVDSESKWKSRTFATTVYAEGGVQLGEIKHEKNFLNENTTDEKELEILNK